MYYRDKRIETQRCWLVAIFRCLFPLNYVAQIYGILLSQFRKIKKSIPQVSYQGFWTMIIIKPLNEICWNVVEFVHYHIKITSNLIPWFINHHGKKKPGLESVVWSYITSFLLGIWRAFLFLQYVWQWFYYCAKTYGII